MAMKYIVLKYEMLKESESWMIHGFYQLESDAREAYKEILMGESSEWPGNDKYRVLKGIVYRVVLKIPQNNEFTLRLLMYGFPLSDFSNSPVMKGIEIIEEESGYRKPL